MTETAAAVAATAAIVRRRRKETHAAAAAALPFTDTTFRCRPVGKNASFPKKILYRSKFTENMYTVERLSFIPHPTYVQR